MWKEFREFAIKGNVIDLAVGVIVGAAFGKIVSSLVNDVIMPPIGLILGKTSFPNLFWNLSSTPAATLEEATKAGLPVIRYGLFLQTVIDFLIVAFVIFIVVKQINRMQRPAAAEKK